MANDEDPEAPGSRLTLLIGLVVAALAAAMAFGRVYRGDQVTLRLCLVVLVATGLAVLMTRQNILLATAVSAAALFVAVGLLVFPDTTHFALPTMRTVRAVGTALRQVGRDANVTAAPAFPVRSLMLAGVTAVWTAAFAAHSLAFRARSPLLALTPLAALLAFAGVVVEDGARPGYVLLFLLGAMVLLFGDAMRRLGQWGPISAWRGRKRFSARTGTTARGAWRVAAGTLGVALFVPWLLPGFGSGAILPVDEGQSRGFSLNPIDDIRPRLVSNPNVLAFTVQTDQATYWRTNTLDTFDGNTWRASDEDYSDAADVSSGVIPPADDATAANRADLVFLHATIRFAGLAQPSMPVPSNPIEVSLSQGTPKYDPVTGTLTLGTDLTQPGTELVVTSELVVPTPEELNAVPAIGARNEPFTALPGDLPREIRQLAAQMTAGGATPYQKIMLLQRTMKGWTYDQHVKADTSSNALLRFLLVSHRGYCQQYAGAMAVLLRALGYPARVAVGFTSGLFDAGTGRWRVTMTDAHTWVEVRFPGYGWLAFDPTPTRADPTIARYASPASVTRSFFTSGPAETVGGGRQGGGRGVRNAFDPGRGELNFLGRPNSELTAKNLPKFVPGTDWRRIGFLVAGALLLAMLLLLPVIKLLRRRWTRTRGKGGGRVLSAYTAVLHTAADVGMGRRPAETPEEYRARLSATVPFSNGDFDALTTLAQRAAYAGGAVAPAEESRASDLARQSAREIRRAAGPLRSLAGAYRISRPNDD